MSGINPNADVIIRMKGLGVGYYNDSDDLWEFIFLRGIDNPEHKLRITVTEYLKNGNSRVLSPQFPNVDVKEISIQSNGFKITGHRHQPEGDRFKRDENHSHYDSRWLVNLSSELYGTLENPTPVRLRNKTGIKLTYMKINGATLYTHGRTDPFRPYRIVEKATQIDIPSSPRVIGNFVGVDIDWKGSGTRSTSITYPGSTLPVLRPDSEIDYYEIEINNDCPDLLCPPSPDFHYYYEKLIDMPTEYEEKAPDSSKTSLRDFLFNRFGLEDILINREGTETSFLESLGINNITFRRAGKTDCHLVLVDELDGENSLHFLVE